MNTAVRTLVLVAAFALLLPPSALAQDQPVWIDVNVGIAGSASDAQAFTFATRLFSETASFAAAYPKPSRGAEFDFGGGYMLTPYVGVGLSFTGTAHQDAAGLGVGIPHPYFFNATAVAGGATEQELTRAEGGAHIQAMFVPLHADTLRVRLFAGPTFFRYQADMVRDIAYRQTATPFSPANLVTITSFQAEEVEGTGWGLHVGGDVSYFFSRVFGLGGFARFSRGSVSVNEPMSERAEDLRVGGIQAGGGVRFRF